MIHETLVFRDRFVNFHAYKLYETKVATYPPTELKGIHVALCDFARTNILYQQYPQKQGL